MAGYRVVTEALREEAKWWKLRADHVHEIANAVQGATLATSAFFTGDPVALALSAVSAAPESAAYEEFRAWVESTLRQGTEQFHELATVLEKIARKYEEAEAVAEIDLRKAYEK
ncbi:hypothetical protein ATK36_2106 [Amycolatopsis sulphurea]|uniref:Excreted virulence factor EspC (Type VII ESX diderm) n=1 Tax=Amycolatopsis sulphurea TaxID=76022 RepID=A0A2A9F6P7_9PSEU|nr:hypothetical protein [Amycolatopsis sulphurea]PFG47087.1 hypothetical protein ATK36_2106 [Amycolatopsis sulphurea]